MYFFLIILRPVYGSFHLPAWLVVSFWFLLDVLGLFLNLGRTEGGVAFGAHVGGFVFGMAWIAVMRKLCGNRFPGQLLEESSEVDLRPVVLRHESPTTALADDGVKYFLSENGQEMGPYPRSIILDMLNSGAVDSERSFYWKEGMAEWLPAADLRNASS